MSTQEKILETALSLYNSKGTDTVTIRHIAAKMGISHGNVGYHFPSTKDIVRALFVKMTDELNELMARANSSKEGITPERIYKNTHAVFSILEKYRFILLDFASITRKDKFVRDTYRKIMANRKGQLFFLFHTLQDNGLMRKDIPEIVYERLIKAILIITNAWLGNHAVLEDSLNENQASNYAEVLFSLYIPYLTEKGIDQFKDLLKTYKKA